MRNILEYMSGEHERCDVLFANAEQAAAKGHWDEARKLFSDFAKELENHFTIEEQKLFPTVERAMGNTGGPIAVMRMEHSQMRELLENSIELIEQQDRDGFLGASETLLVLMQQHNMKEEQIVYPMTDRILGEDTRQVLSELENSL
jgi:hemerythrin-like domain-containing protein